MAWISYPYPFKRGPSALGTFPHARGLPPKRVVTIPPKVDQDQQEQFRINALEPLLDEARPAQRAILIDATHYLLAAFLGILWSSARLFVRTSAGTRRFNVLGALNAITHELVTVTNDTSFTAESVCELLRRIAQLHLRLPITVVVGNAAYQKCKMVRDLAAQLNTELLFLPANSPNLNLIGRLWKFVKKQLLYSHYYATLGDLREAITVCLRQTHTTHKQELDSLLTLSFPVFKKRDIVPIRGIAPTLKRNCACS